MSPIRDDSDKDAKRTRMRRTVLSPDHMSKGYINKIQLQAAIATVNSNSEHKKKARKENLAVKTAAAATSKSSCNLATICSE